MRLFDAHCHLCDMKDFSVPENMLVVTAGYSHESNLKNAEICKSHANVYCTMGIAPQTAQRAANLEAELPGWIDFIRKSEVRPVAIGEIGLDYHWAKNDEDRRRQRFCFSHMLNLAHELQLPVVIHSRDAESDVLATLKNWKSPFLMHCFSGSLEEARQVFEKGGIISIPPIRSKERKKVMKAAPLSSLLAETDAPYIGKTLNDINLSLQMIADAKGISAEEAAEATYGNAARFFQIKEG